MTWNDAKCAITVYFPNKSFKKIQDQSQILLDKKGQSSHLTAIITNMAFWASVGKGLIKLRSCSYMMEPPGSMVCVSPPVKPPLLCGLWESGLGGSDRVRLCPGGGGGGLFLDRVELPPGVSVEGGPDGGGAGGAIHKNTWGDEDTHPKNIVSLPSPTKKKTKNPETVQGEETGDAR